MPPLNRRDFIQLSAMSLALAACTKQPLEPIVPYAVTPRDRVQGEPQWFATSIPYRGFAFGVLARSFEGRPAKLEGNRDHPASLGATNAIVQASILDLYDPTRSTRPRKNGVPSSWSAFATEVHALLARGARLRILTQTVTSPTLLAQINRLLAANRGARWHVYEPVSRDSIYGGTRMAFGTALEPLYHFDKADVVVALDADILSDDPASVRYAHDFMQRRRMPEPNRLYAIEPMPTVTGAAADHRFARRASDIAQIAAALAARISGEAVSESWIDVVARDLLAHRGAALVVAGEAQPPQVHALAHAMNATLGAIGKTIDYIDAIGQETSLADLTHDLAAGSVDVLLIAGGNPAFDAPADYEFAKLVARVPFSAHLSPYVDDTSARTTWHLPESHPLESWGDSRAFDGTASIVQPLIAPLYDTRSSIEWISMLLGTPAGGYDLVRGTWPNTDWNEALARGTIGSSAPIRPSPPHAGEKVPQADEGALSLELNLRPDPTLFDGRHARNGWLQELPKPITKLAWSNAALMSPQLAEHLGVKNEDVIEISARGKSVRAPVWMLPGHAEHSITLHLGHGEFGVNAYPLFFSDSRHTIAGVSVRKTDDVQSVISTQQHNTLDGRDHVRVTTLAHARRNPDWVRDPDKEPKPAETLREPYHYNGHAWAMSIDLGACIGCGGCVVACNAENNIPVVGPDQVRLGRELHWLRIDRYFDGPVDEPRIHHQPVPCMHCENAPCEQVCPVEATLHSSEGLNEMVYNRCIGTRYCSNNCPYKVRHFNFLDYAPPSDLRDLMANPDVTVRSRGVMEKCTYCVQRIERARVAASNERRPIRDGEIVTACQQACPTQAIVFGDRNDETSMVAHLKHDRRDYALLAELNTRPRTTYLGKVRNPNPELETE